MLNLQKHFVLQQQTQARRIILLNNQLLTNYFRKIDTYDFRDYILAY